jgi:hypothetical protein
VNCWLLLTHGIMVCIILNNSLVIR